MDALLVYGTSANARQGQAQVHYLTDFLGHQDAYVLLVPGREPILFVQYANHVPHAERVAHAEVRWGGLRSIDAVADALRAVGSAPRIGVVGPVPFGEHHRLVDRMGDGTIIDVTPAFVRLRLVKSDEELAWMARAAAITDEALRVLVRRATSGVSELELQADPAAAAIRAGGQPHFLYLSSTSMTDPDRIVPQQDLSDRRLSSGDAVILELSAAAGAYAGQILRTLTIDARPTDLYRQLHDVAWEAFNRVAGAIRPGASARDVIAAASVIEENGFTICDDLVHGYGGGYLPPVLRTPGAAHRPVEDFTFEKNMTVVIQPNVITTDRRAGVQVGELVRVTEQGIASLHHIGQRALRGGEQLTTA